MKLEGNVRAVGAALLMAAGVALGGGVAEAAPRDELVPGGSLAPGGSGKITGPSGSVEVTPQKRDPRCSNEVADAFAAQRDKGVFTMKTRMIDQRGVVFMTGEYVLPLKMHQSVKTLTSPEPVETILIAGRGWTRTGGTGDWQRLNQEQVGQLADEFQGNVVDPGRDPLFYTCKDDQVVEGKTVRVYEGVQLTPLGKVEPTSPVRIVHVDDATGLPVMNAVAPREKPEQAYFKATYAYPETLTIDAPTR